MFRLTTVTALVALSIACDPTTPTGRTPPAEEEVESDVTTDTEVEAEPAPCAQWDGEFGPLQVDQWDWNGREVWVSSPDCCDQFREVRDAQTCEYLCAPDGGFTGLGDGLCPSFYDEATHTVLIWTRDEP